MPSLTVAQAFFHEFFSRDYPARRPEPDLVMDDPEKVAAYTRASREDGVLQAVYLFQCAHVSEVICRGDVVLDLGCGPGTLLTMTARLHPQTQFVGLDLSEDMLDKARSYAASQGVSNVRFVRGDMCRLSEWPAASVDAVISYFALHHLPDAAHLGQTLAEVRRVLKPGGGLCLADLAHLKSSRAIDCFVRQNAHLQPELFTQDYRYSLEAAFDPATFDQLYQTYLSDSSRLFKTFWIPYMLMMKSSPRQDQPPRIQRELRAIRERLDRSDQTDLQDLGVFFRLGGLKTPYL